MKRNLLKTLLVAVCLLVGQSVWADVTETEIVNQTFEDGTTKLFTESSRITVSNFANTGSGSTKVLSLATASNSGNGYSLATYDFSGLYSESPTAMKVEFDFYIPNFNTGYHRYFTIGQASLRTGFAKNTYPTSGAMFAFGVYRTGGSNYFSINGATTTAAASATNVLGAWAHAEIYVDLSAKNVDYSITSLDGNTTYYSGTDVAFYDTDAYICNQIDFYDCQNSQTSYLDNLVITKYVDSSSHSYTINAVSGETTLSTFTGGFAAEGASYGTYIPKYVNYNGNYYVLDDSGNTNLTNYKATYTMGSANETKKINYTLTSDVVFFSEWENATQSTSTSGYYYTEESSNYSGGYLKAVQGNADKDLHQAFTIATAGTYAIIMPYYNSSAKERQHVLYLDGTEEGNKLETKSVAATTSGVFCKTVELTAGSHTIYLKENGATLTSLFDYLLVQSVPIAEGDYYLKNKATGAYFAAGLNWNTKAITNSIGHIVTMTMNSDCTWKVDVDINSKYLSSGLWCDGDAQNWILTSDGAGYLTIGDGTNFITGGASGEALSLTTGTGDNTKWQFLTAAEWKAENVTRLDAAAANNGVDATFYIPAANFNRRDGENSKWQGSPGINGEEVSANNNFNAEKFTNPYAAFDVYQELTGLKPGAYKLTAQGFYRNGLDNTDATVRRALLYANDVTTPLVNIASDGKDAADASNGFSTAKNGKYVPNSQTDVSKAFNAGYYNNELYVVVGDAGTLRLGVKKTDASGSDEDWACFDNFQLTYYGTTVSKTMTSAGWATFCSPYPLDFSSSITNLTKAYTITGASGSTLTLSEISGTVPANTGVLLEGTAGTIAIPVTESSSTNVSSNKLVGVTAATEMAANSIYVLMDGNKGVGFYSNNNAFTVGANTAYLPIDFASAREFYLFEGEATGINEELRMKNEESVFFDLQGRRVAQPTKGLYIVNGKKVIVK